MRSFISLAPDCTASSLPRFANYGLGRTGKQLHGLFFAEAYERAVRVLTRTDATPTPACCVRRCDSAKHAQDAKRCDYRPLQESPAARLGAGNQRRGVEHRDARHRHHGVEILLLADADVA